MLPMKLYLISYILNKILYTESIVIPTKICFEFLRETYILRLMSSNSLIYFCIHFVCRSYLSHEKQNLDGVHKDLVGDQIA